ncbi:hypothetical protein [Chryseobacterium polytrichastri]|uniref:Uncharacterized protein n=1 Tax=Chryseobacterium polytrichastri TaxID=1302687 RepID=A0A1M7IGE2_9FLAO|nr:hypothetical protein [Chryseobacterium polytrichastri]SHM39854.1 hypothetical protein SAMN05444267_104617 [Chryseobacterium polytrichastri]
MKKWLPFFFILLISILHAQELKDFSVPKNATKVLETEGDLDKDELNETVIVYNTGEKIEYQGYKRKFYILKKINGKLKIWKENSSLLESSEAGFYPESNQLEVSIKNNCLVILQSFFTNSRHTDTSKHTFRFQNGDFYLIGALNTFDDTCEFNFLNDINFSTGKVIIDEKYSDCDGDEDRKIPKDVHNEFFHKFSPLIKMDDFRIGENKFKIPDSKKEITY